MVAFNDAPMSLAHMCQETLAQVPAGEAGQVAATLFRHIDSAFTLRSTAQLADSVGVAISKIKQKLMAIEACGGTYHSLRFPGTRLGSSLALLQGPLPREICLVI